MFLFGRKKPGKKLYAPAPPPDGEQKRSAFRMPIEFDLLYSLEGRKGRRSATANDLSAGGLRLATDEDLIKNSILHLEFTLPHDFLNQMTVEKEVFQQTPFGLRPETVRVQPNGFAAMRISAKVLITFFDRDAKLFAHGMSFFDIDDRTQEELQRFMHLWQINYLRQRNESELGGARD
jgi:c-di-GMP-binding flagellar brake protein YcgR